MKPSTIGDLIRSAMERQDHGVSTLAKCMGVSRQAVHAWLAGKALPAGNQLSNLAEYVGVSVHHLMRLYRKEKDERLTVSLEEATKHP